MNVIVALCGKFRNLYILLTMLHCQSKFYSTGTFETPLLKTKTEGNCNLIKAT